MRYQTPISVHVDLFRYWDSKRAGRTMPAKRDIDPTEIPQLIPHIAIIDRIEDRFRYRLVGTTISQELGKELTGQLVGSYVGPAHYAAAVIDIYEHVFATRTPVFTTGEYRTASDLTQSISRLLLPLSEDNSAVNMVMLSRVVRFNRNLRFGRDWLKGAPGQVRSTTDVQTLAEVEHQCSEWDARLASEDDLLHHLPQTSPAGDRTHLARPGVP